MGEDNYHMNELVNKYRPCLIQNLIGRKAKLKARNIVQWLQPIFGGKYLALSSLPGAGRHTIADVACQETNRVCLWLDLQKHNTANSVANEIFRLRTKHEKRNIREVSHRLVIVAENCKQFPRHELELLHQSIMAICNVTIPIIFFVDIDDVDDYLNALPNCLHIDVTFPRVPCIKLFLNVVAFMEGRIPTSKFDSLILHHRRNIGQMIRHINDWTKECTKKLTISRTGDGPAIRNAVKAFQQVGGRVQKQINQDVAMLVTEDQADTSKKIKEAESKGIPVVTSTQFHKYLTIVKKIRKQNLLNGWTFALNEILKHHQLVAEHADDCYMFDILSHNRKNFIPDQHHSILVITSMEMNFHHHHYSKLCYEHSGLDVIVTQNQMEDKWINSICTPSVEIFDCCSKNVSILGLNYPTKEVVMSALHKLFQSKSSNKYVFYLGEESSEGWELFDNWQTRVTGSEIADLLRNATTPTILGKRGRLVIYPGLFISGWDKFKFGNPGLGEVCIPSLIDRAWMVPTDNYIEDFAEIMVSNNDAVNLVGRLAWI